MSGSLWQSRRRLGRVSMRLALGLSLGPALLLAPRLANPQAASPGSGGVPADGAAWLHRIQQAAANSSYEGTLMFSAGGVVSSSRLQHYCDGKQRYERIEVLDGQARLQYRHNEQLITFWPASKLAMVEQRDPVAEFPALPLAAGSRAADSYDVRAVGKDRVAGRDAELLMLKPRDKHRYAHRLWADRETGLLLRSDVLGPAGEVLETSAFTTVQTGSKPQPDAILRPMKKLEGYRVLRPVAERTQIEAEGWMLAKPVPGFALVSCVKRPLDAGVVDAGPPVQVLQSVFSDGLAHVSVFIEPYDPARHKQPMSTSLGATHTLMNRRGDWWVTIVGEVPLATVQLFETMLERKR